MILIVNCQVLLGKQEDLVPGIQIIFLVGTVENTWNSTDLPELEKEAEMYNDILQVLTKE